MFCNQCGNELPDGASFCNKCGAKQEMPAPVAPAPAPVEPAAPAPVEPTPAAPTINLAKESEAPKAPVQAAPIAPAPAPVNPAPAPAAPIAPAPAPVNPAPAPAAPVAPVPAPVNPVPAPAAPAKKEKKGVPFFVWVLLVVLVVAAIAVGLIFALGGNGKKSSGYPEMSSTKSVIVSNDTAVTLDGTIYELDSRIYGSNYNKDMTVVAYVLEGNELFVIDSNLKPVSVAEDISAYKVSFSGDYVAYTTNDDDDYNHQTLYLYDVKKDNSVKIDTSVYPQSFVLSPNGKYVAYLRDYEGRTDNALCLAGIGKDKEKIDKDGCYPIGISDNGKNLYYVDNSDYDSVKLYLYTGKDRMKVAKDIDNGAFYFNESVTELVFNRKGNGYFYTPNMGEEAVKISSSYVYGFFHGNENGDALRPYNTGTSAIIYGTKSFKDSAFEAGDSIYWLNKNGTDSVKICDEDYMVATASDGKSALALKKGIVYKISKFHENMEPQPFCEAPDRIKHVIASDDLSQVYVVTEEDELYYVKGMNNLEKISNDFTFKRNKIAYNEAAKAIYYIEDGDLYSATKNAKSRQLVMEDVQEIFAVADGVCFETEEGDAYFAGKKEPVLVYENEYSRRESTEANTSDAAVEADW